MNTPGRQRALEDVLEDLRATVGKRALPDPDHTNAHFWRSAAEGRLVLQHCRTCDAYQYYPRALCTTCAGEPEWLDASGRGRLYTFTVIRQNRSEAFAALVPYAVGIVELDEGVRMMSNIVGCPVEDLEIGMPLEVVLLSASDDVGLPFWRPCSRPST